MQAAIKNNKESIKWEINNIQNIVITNSKVITTSKVISQKIHDIISKNHNCNNLYTKYKISELYRKYPFLGNDMYYNF
jgi:hypothetical protein